MDQTTIPRVGFAGLGAMGYGMASNLLKTGFSVTGFDLNPTALEKLASLGGSVATSIAEASRGQGKFLVMVATPAQVDSIVFGPEGLCTTLPESAILCLFSTLPPTYVSELPPRLAREGRDDILVMDCPVSGGVVGATSGGLSIMIGGENSTFEVIKPELEAVSAPNRLFYCGGLGAASTVKMLNQHLAGTHIVAAAEVLSFTAALGLSTRESYQIIMNSISSSWIFGDRGISMLNADWTPKSAVTIFTKDLGIVSDSADKESFPCPIASVALQVFLERAARGGGRDDDASVVCNYEDVIGKKVCQNEKGDKSPSATPPKEFVSDNGAPLSGLSILGEAQASLESLFASLDRCSGDGPGLFFIPNTDLKSMGALLERLPWNSIVGISGFRDPQNGKTILKAFTARHPELHFLDFHVIPAPDQSTYQFLFSAENSKISAAIEALVVPYVTPVPVTGKFGSATAIYLAIRLGSLIHISAAAECYNFALAKGVSAQLVYDLIAGAAGSSVQFKQYFPDMLRQDFTARDIGKFDTIENAMVDLEALKRGFEDLKFPGRLLDATHQVFKSANRRVGNKDASIAAIIRFWD